jgi:hypothetical protein
MAGAYCLPSVSELLVFLHLVHALRSPKRLRLAASRSHPQWGEGVPGALGTAMVIISSYPAELHGSPRQV